MCSSDLAPAPHVIAGVNVVAADDAADARAAYAAVQRSRVRTLLGRGKAWSDDEAERVLGSPAGQAIRAMGTYSAVGTRAEVQAHVERFAAKAEADELMVVHAAQTIEARLRSAELLVA